MELPKSLGGLNIGNLKRKNLGLLFRWFWRLANGTNSLWYNVIKAKYGYGLTFSLLDISTPNRGGLWRAICGAILQHPVAKITALTNIRTKFGGGENTLFWHDLWVRDKPLKWACPRLFLLSPSLDAMVSSLGFWDGQVWKWAYSWKRDLRPQDIQEEHLLKSTLNRVVLSPGRKDTLIWIPHKTGEFSVKSFYLELTKQSVDSRNSSFNGLWCGLIPHRIELFTWFSLLGRLNTKSKLISTGAIPGSVGLRTFCNIFPERCDHLLMHCKLVWKIWCWWLNIWGLSWSPPI